MAEAAQTAPEKKSFEDYMKDLDLANLKLAEKLHADTAAYQTKMEALTGTTFASYPTFQPFVGIAQIIAAVKQSAVDRDIITSYLAAIVAAGTPDKADLIRTAVRKAIAPA